MTFITEAEKGKNRHWLWFLAGTVCVLIAFILGQTPLSVYIGDLQSRGIVTAEQVAKFYTTADFEQLGIPSALGLLLLLTGFITALLVLGIVVVFVHGRKFRSLISSRPVDWRKILFGFIIWFGLTALAELMLYLMEPDVYHFTFHGGRWLSLILVVLLLLPLQTSFEELFIRGYLFQRIGLSVRYPWIAVIITAILFATPHSTNPEIHEFGFGIMMVYYISVGLFLAAITILDDGLEYALGIHAATNVYGAGFVTYQGSALQMDALIKADMIDTTWIIILFGISACLFYIIVKTKYGLRKIQTLFDPVKDSETQPAYVSPTELQDVHNVNG